MFLLFLCDCIRRLVSTEELKLDILLSYRFHLPLCVFSYDSFTDLILKANYPIPVLTSNLKAVDCIC
jgi:hypothetical protein